MRVGLRALLRRAKRTAPRSIIGPSADSWIYTARRIGRYRVLAFIDDHGFRLRKRAKAAES